MHLLNLSLRSISFSPKRVMGSSNLLRYIRTVGSCTGAATCFIFRCSSCSSTTLRCSSHFASCACRPSSMPLSSSPLHGWASLFSKPRERIFSPLFRKEGWHEPTRGRKRNRTNDEWNRNDAGAFARHVSRMKEREGDRSKTTRHAQRSYLRFYVARGDVDASDPCQTHPPRSVLRFVFTERNQTTWSRAIRSTSSHPFHARLFRRKTRETSAKDGNEPSHSPRTTNVDADVSTTGKEAERIRR